MKTQFVTDDGKVFATKEAAEQHEAATNDKGAVDEIVKKIEKIDEKINALKTEIGKLLDEKDALLEEWKQYMTPEQKKTIDTFESILNYFLGGDDN